MWFLYINESALLWDCKYVPGPFEGPLGSNWWMVSTKTEADKFVARMLRNKYYNRGHTHGYTY